MSKKYLLHQMLPIVIESKCNIIIENYFQSVNSMPISPMKNQLIVHGWQVLFFINYIN